jgi:hypothetical protein
MMIAGAGLLPGAGALPGIGSALGVSSGLTSAISSFTSLPIVSQFSSVVSSATNLLSSGPLNALRTMGQDFTALTNAIPSSFSSALSAIAPGGVFDGGFTGAIFDTAKGIMGGPLQDLTQFGQVFNAAQGYLGQANQFINSNLNIGSLASTFGDITGGMNNIISGGFNQVTNALGAFGDDLTKLGSLVDMGNLSNLGDPSALVKQLASVGGITSELQGVLTQAGLNINTINNLVSGQYSGITDTANKLIYQGMEKIVGSELQQVKNILGVTTGGINTMADLLNPAKILPTSYTTLTMPTPDGLRGIYETATSVNTNIEKWLQDPTAPAYTGDDPIVRARLGLDTFDNVDTRTIIT